MVPVRNSKALAEKICILLDNPLLCRKMGKAGRSRAEEVFDVNKVVDKHIKIYAELLREV
jgi:glycosyltransferase involved in cell wall biosynthesis